MSDLVGLVRSVPAWPFLGLLVVVVVWYMWHVRRRLYFLPWENLSNDPTLNIGASLSEVFVAEIERVRRIHETAHRNPGLWNERARLPFLQRSGDALPAAIRQMEQLGGPGWFAKAVGVLPLFAPPATVRGSIHLFGKAMRLQVAVENARRPWVGIRPIIMVPFDFERPVENPAQILSVVKQFAHEVFLKLAELETFKSTQSFMDFTEALEHHLRWEAGEPDQARSAIAKYETVLVQDQANAAALFNKAVLHYAQYEPQANSDAIAAFKAAAGCSSAGVALRAQAWGGLANAFCQARQRHGERNDRLLGDALRWAQRAYDTELGADAPVVVGKLTAWARSWGWRLYRWFVPARARASVVKAFAYANQVVAENREGKRERLAYEERAIALYLEATQLNREFTVAYNNLGYLFLKRAESAPDLRSARPDLRKAQRFFAKAVRSDPSYQHAYDNLGNVELAYARHLRANAAIERLRRAIGYYRMALSRKPTYKEAIQDVAKAYVAMALCRVMAGDDPLRDDETRQYVAEAVRFRAEAIETGADAEKKGEPPLLQRALQQFQKDFACTRQTACPQDLIDRLFEPVLQPVQA